jgi:flavin-dependent dehydrogenase
MKEGAQFFEHTAFRKVLLEDGRVTGVLASDGTRTKEFRAGLVVECTGDTAVVKSQLPAEWPVAEPVRDRALCYRGILEVGEVEEPTTIRMYTDQEVAPNCYWWFFPEGDHRANVGLGVLPRDAGMLRRSYTEIVSRFDVRATVQEAGAYVPVQRPPVSLVGPGVLVLGDAAPTVSPISGGGLESTMEASYEASKHLEEAAAGGWSLEACWPMNEYLRRGGARLAVEDVVKHAMWEGGTGFIDRGLKFLRGGLGLARLLVDADLRGVAMRARKAKKHFESYPKSPRDVKKWAAGLDPVHSPNF